MVVMVSLARTFCGLMAAAKIPVKTKGEAKNADERKSVENVRTCPKKSRFARVCGFFDAE